MYSTDELLPSQYKEADELPNVCDLSVPEDMDLRIGVFDGFRLIATGALCGKVIQGIAVDPSHRGEGLAASVVMKLISRAIERGISHVLLFTKASECSVFSELGLRKIASVEGGAALLEWGSPGIEEYLVRLEKVDLPESEELGCVVMNANPFTRGHLHLVETAAVECDQVVVIVVREDKSTFPFSVRMDLVRKGLAHIENVIIVDGGDYVVSSATFPSYFTGEKYRSKVHAELDLEVFCRHIAPALGISCRYVGTEPLCPVTSAYNLAMKVRLPEEGIEVREILRMECDHGVISASRVRCLIEATEGVNTQKGLMFSLGLLCASAGNASVRSEKISATDLCGWVVQAVSGIVENLRGSRVLNQRIMKK